MEKGLKNLNQAYRQAQRKQGTYEINEDSGVAISDLEEDPNENPSPLTDAPNQIPLAYQHPNGYHHHQQTRVPSIHSILQHPNLMPQQAMGHQSMAQQPMGYTPYAPHS